MTPSALAVINGYYRMKYKVISISLDKVAHDALNKRLKELGMTRSEYVRMLLRDSGKTALETTRKRLKAAAKVAGKTPAAVVRDAVEQHVGTAKEETR